MTILLLHKITISAVVTQVPPGNTTTGTIASYDFATGGPGGINEDNRIVIAIARVNEHSETSALKTHGYIETMALFTRISGTMAGPFSGNFSVVNMSDTGVPAIITFDVSGSQILVNALVGASENGPGTFSGLLEIYMAD